MKIRITRTVKLHQNILKKVVAELLPINGPMTFIEERTPLMFQVDEFEWDDLLGDFYAKLALHFEISCAIKRHSVRELVTTSEVNVSADGMTLDGLHN